MEWTRPRESFPFKEKLELIKELDFSEVFNFWKQAETKSEVAWRQWQKAAKLGTVSDWEEWRQKYIDQLGLENLDWKLFRLENPFENISNFWGGPFKTWRKLFYKDKPTRTFGELIGKNLLANNHPETFSVVNQITANFPYELPIIAIHDQERIVIVEGMRRCCAAALLRQRGVTPEKSLPIALAQINKEEMKAIFNYQDQL